jgi:hypothetical protein
MQRGRKSGYASVGMTKGRGALPFRFDDGDYEQQVPPLRYASVGMTLLFGVVFLLQLADDDAGHRQIQDFFCNDKVWCLLASLAV